jgi:hypothetical protein
VVILYVFIGLFSNVLSLAFFIGGLQISVLLEDGICPLKHRQFFLDLKAVKAKNVCPDPP